MEEEIIMEVTETVIESLPQLDFTIFNSISPTMYILSVVAIIIAISCGSEAIVMIFTKLFNFCETAFNEHSDLEYKEPKTFFDKVRL